MADGSRSLALAARGVVRRYRARGGLGASGAQVVAVAGVTLELEVGELYGLVGESGAGKSTLARLLVGLERPDSGAVTINGQTLDTLRGAELREARRRAQLVFQDPAAALDPLQTVGSVVTEPLLVHRTVPTGGRRRRVRELLSGVGLPTADEFLARRPAELSGGERQRLAIARALACEPRALVLDEPVSALDVSVRGQVLNLLSELHERLSLTTLLIAHDLDVVAFLCDRVGVMLGGYLVEEGRADEVIRRPRHPFTAAMVGAAAPVGHAHRLEAGPPGACPYSGRCPSEGGECVNAPPKAAAATGHCVACYFPRGS